MVCTDLDLVEASVLVPAEIPKALLAEVVPSMLVAALDEHNTTHNAEERIRLRMALHAGEVVHDEHGVTAASVILTFRLLDSPALKAALTHDVDRQSTGDGWLGEQDRSSRHGRRACLSTLLRQPVPRGRFLCLARHPLHLAPALATGQP